MTTSCNYHQLRVGRITYQSGQKCKPEYPDFTEIEVMTPSTEYGSLSPYVLYRKIPVGPGKVKRSLLENEWQSSKIYPSIPASRQTYSRYDRRVIWNWPAEKHVDDNGDLLPEYWTWRRHLKFNKDAVRYPVGFAHRGKCIGACRDDHPDERLDYISSRKLIYLPLYIQEVQQQRQFKELKERLAGGENLLIMEVDGPHQESTEYYESKYDVGPGFIEDGTMLCSPENLEIMLNDAKHPFGHGYCLAMALLGYDASFGKE